MLVYLSGYREKAGESDLNTMSEDGDAVTMTTMGGPSNPSEGKKDGMKNNQTRVPFGTIFFILGV